MSPSDRADTVMLTILPARRHHTVGANCILSDVSHSSRHAWMHRCMHACVLVRRVDAQRSTSALERLAHRHVLTHRPQALQVCLHSTANVGSLQCHTRQGRSSHEQHSCRTCASSQLAPEGTMRPCRSQSSANGIRCDSKPFFGALTSESMHTPSRRKRLTCVRKGSNHRYPNLSVCL